MDKLLKTPLLERKWRYLAFGLFPFPILLLIIIKILDLNPDYNTFAVIIYGSWILALGVLINLRRKDEDELIEKIRLISYQRGVYFLMAGLLAIISIELIKNGSLSSGFITVFEALLLLMVYILVTFHYLLWKISQE